MKTQRSARWPRKWGSGKECGEADQAMDWRDFPESLDDCTTRPSKFIWREIAMEYRK